MPKLRNRLVGEALPYQGRFRKLRVEHEGLLSCLLDSQTPADTSAPTVVSHSRKEYAFLKPNMIHEDCDKKNIPSLSMRAGYS